MLPVRNANKIYLYQFLTLGFYFFYWAQRTGKEVNQLAGRQMVPSAWYFALPGFGAYWWMWQYSDALYYTSRGRIKKSDTFLLFLAVTAAFGAPFGFGSHVPSPTHSDTNISWHEFWILAVIIVGVAYLFAIFAIGFFCSYTQKKLNTVFGPPAPQPAPTPPQAPPHA